MKQFIITVIVFLAGQSILEAQPYQQFLDWQIAHSIADAPPQLQTGKNSPHVQAPQGTAYADFPFG